MKISSRVKSGVNSTITLNKINQYLHIVRSGDFDLDQIRTSLREIEPLLQREGIEQIMTDCRDINFEGGRFIDIDTLAMCLNQDIRS
ncbi:MAG: hypothetical protein V7629_03890 [Motiliproteus sp.]